MVVATLPKKASDPSQLNPAQQQAVYSPANQALRVVAGAGTGKTELIAHRFVHLVKEFQQQGIASAHRRIAVLTFTNEAALNMRLRIDAQLTANMSKNTAYLDAQAYISNFHQLGARILRQHALYLGLSPNFTILESLAQRLLFNRVLESIIEGEYTLAPFQKMLARILGQYGLGDIAANVFTPEALKRLGIRALGDILDAETLFCVIQKAKASGLSPKAFYQTAMAQSLQLSQALKTLPVETVYEATAKNEKGKPDALALICGYLESWQAHLSQWADKHWQPLVETEKNALAQGLEPKPGDYKKSVDGLASLYTDYDRSLRAYLPAARLLDESISRTLDEEQTLYEALAAIVATVYALYQHTLRIKDACDFDDLINHCLTLFEENPDIARFYRELFLHVIVDEFQDSNTSQLKLLKYLVRENQENLTVVGDEKQSIYAFRFAQPENLSLVFDDPAACLSVSLETNYRSTPPILAAANLISAKIVGNQSQALSPCEKLSHCRTPVTWVNFGDQTQAARESIALHKEWEAEWIAAEIERLAQAHQKTDIKTESAFAYREIAILVKSHTKAELVQEALNARAIPSVRKKNLGFFNDTAIKNALALMQLMVNLRDDRSLVRVLQAKLSQRELYILSQAQSQAQKAQAGENSGQRQKPSLFEVLFALSLKESIASELSSQVRAALIDFCNRLLSLRKRQGRLSPAQLFKALADEIGFIDAETPEYLKHQQRANLRTLEKWLLLLSSKSQIQPTLREILSVLENYRDDPGLELPVSANGAEEENAVQIMTFHSAKGLEFPTVFVAWCEKPAAPRFDGLILFDPQNQKKAGFGLFTSRPLLNPQQKEPPLAKIVHQLIWQRPQLKQEEQRLFYVALTRAERQLYVLRSTQSPDWSAAPQLPDTGFVRVINIAEEV
ncbi:MAG: ATP-dependent helicase [Vampirovibrionales bacterium]|nr:ATP-dependent helicase [Vampirovibrionales bacterium]